MSLTHADLCSGIGGFSLAARMAGGFRTVLYCEIEPFCREVLLARIADGQLDAASIAHDLRRLDGSRWRGRLDLLTAGFPCQDISVAGRGAGLDGERSGLFFDVLAFVSGARPRGLVLENVPALRTRGIDRIIVSLEALGYEVEDPIVVGAEHVGAPHRRERVWIVAHLHNDRATRNLADTDGERIGFENELWRVERSHWPRKADASGCGAGVADAEGRGLRTDGSARADTGHADECGANRLADAARARLEWREPARFGRAGGCAAEHGESDDFATDDDWLDDILSVGGTQPIAPHERAWQPMADSAGQHGKSGDAQPGRRPIERIATRWPSRPGERQHDWERPRLAEFRVGGAIDGLPARLASRANKLALRALGNSIVPQVASPILSYMRDVLTVNPAPGDGA